MSEAIRHPELIVRQLLVECKLLWRWRTMTSTQSLGDPGRD